MHGPCWLCLQQLFNRLTDPAPHTTAIHVALIQQRVVPLGSVQQGIVMGLDDLVGGDPDITV